MKQIESKRVKDKREDWLTSEELAQRICACAATIRGWMNRFYIYGTLGDNIKYIKQDTNIRVLCLRNEEQVIKEFCNKVHFTQNHDVEIVPEEWLTARDLLNRGYVVGRHSEIYGALKQYQSEMLECIQLKPNGSLQILSVRCDAIDLFCAKANLKRPTPADKKWLSAPDLVKQGYIGATYTEIHNAMRQHKAEMPKHIRQRNNGLRNVWCLHSSAVEEFCKLSGLNAINTKQR